ncbi:MAG: class I tRNA ligase family protein, partial [Lachnospiraceae bacterium]|nr:class I tRNA ligase family protein [Lachnospiraceae bacterium]
CEDCGEMVVSKDEVHTCPKCGSKHMVQDPDTLDTWFSSALWPFSTLGWPENTADLDYFYPNDVLITGYDIIFFWVIRMVFSGYEQMGKAPFHTVLFHGLIRDDQGRKMSKSLGNGIDPLEVIDKYGADALRLTLITGNAPGNDMRFYLDRVEASRNFANKVWNASRFIMMNLEDYKDEKPLDSELTTTDRWILSRINRVTKDVTENLDKYELGIAVSKVQDFVWDEFCDWYIEFVKPRMYDKSEEGRNSKNAALWTLKKVLSQALKLLHPYMPFITEEIYCTLHPEEESIMIADWPVYDESIDDQDAEKGMIRVMDLVREVRNVRTEMNVPPSKKAKLIVVSEDASVRDIYSDLAGIFSNLAGASEVFVQSDNGSVPEKAVSAVIPDATAYMPLDELVDMGKELERLQKEQKRLEGELKRSNGMLGNQKFLDKAPAEKIEEEEAKLADYENMLLDVKKRIAEM